VINKALNQPTLEIKDFTVNEGEAAVFSIFSSCAANKVNKVKLTIDDGTAIAPGDYNLTGLQYSTDGVTYTSFKNGDEVSFEPGTNCLFVKVPTIDDNVVDGNTFPGNIFGDRENFTISAVPVEGFSGGTVIGTASIFDNDIQKISVVSNGDKTEGDYASWTVSVDKNSEFKWTWAKYQLLDVTTQNAVDYDPNTLQISTDGGSNWSSLKEDDDFGFAFKPGVTSAQVRVKTNTDDLVEGTEAVTLRVSPNGEGYRHVDINVVEATVNIKDGTVAPAPTPTPPVGTPNPTPDPTPTPPVGTPNPTPNPTPAPLPTLTVKDFAITEGQDAVFVVTASAAVTGQNSVKLNLSNGTAIAPGDYTNTGLQISTDGVNFTPFVNGAEVSFANGKDKIYLKAPTIDDNVVDSNIFGGNFFGDRETFTLTATPVSGFSGGTVIETASIIDNDQQKISVVANGDKTENDFASWTVSVDKNSEFKWGWAKYELVDGTTQRSVDYDPNTLQVSTDGGNNWAKLNEGDDFGFAFKPGVNTAQVRVKTNTDSLVEGNEAVILKVTPNNEGLGHLAAGTVQATVNITDATVAPTPTPVPPVVTPAPTPTPAPVPPVITPAPTPTPAPVPPVITPAPTPTPAPVPPVITPAPTPTPAPVPPVITPAPTPTPAPVPPVITPAPTPTPAPVPPVITPAPTPTPAPVPPVITPAPTPTPAPVPPVVTPTGPKATLIGTGSLTEGGAAGSYHVQLDAVSDKDRFFTITIKDGTANRVDANKGSVLGAATMPVFTGNGVSVLENQQIAKSFEVYGDSYWKNVNTAGNGYQITDTKDFTVSKPDGTLNAGNTITVKVAAGQSESEIFKVNAWQENIIAPWALLPDKLQANESLYRFNDQENNYIGTGRNTPDALKVREGNETFSVQITNAGDANVVVDKVDVTINDTSKINYISPIAIDLNGDGVQTISAETGVKFDILNSGQAVQTGWISGEDGFLAYDKNGNGSIDDRSELFGGAVGEGFATLATFDSNGDGVVSDTDESFSKLSLWKDSNINGVTDSGELTSLIDAGIMALNVAHSSDFTTDKQGNILGERSTAIASNGQTLEVVDVYFKLG
jgi:Calx-beta domain